MNSGHKNTPHFNILNEVILKNFQVPNRLFQETIVESKTSYNSMCYIERKYWNKTIFFGAPLTCVRTTVLNGHLLPLCVGANELAASFNYFQSPVCSRCYWRLFT